MIAIVTTDREDVLLVPSESRPGDYYIVTITAPTEAICTCPAGQQGNPCKHVVAVFDREIEGAETMSSAENGTSAVAVRQTTMVERHQAQKQSLAMQVEMWDDALQLGAGLVKSGILPKSIDTPEKAAVWVLKAQALDIPPTEAAAYLYPIDGRVGVMGQMVGALVARSGKGRIEIVETDSQHCVAVGYRDGYRPLKITLTLSDLSKRTKNNPSFAEYPADHLRHKAVARVGRTLFADVLSGMDVTVSFGESVEVVDGFEDATGEGIVTVLEGEYRETDTPAEAPPPAAPEKPKPADQYVWFITLQEKRAEVGMSDPKWIGQIVLGPDNARPLQMSDVDHWIDQNSPESETDDGLADDGREPWQAAVEALLSRAVTLRDNR